ncbi:MAG: putative DNA polymerase [uncultured marine phage]|uniref:Putative DNA polymerase n=1 Tax=uncultured marine phage TaxID=707152 RepID=A0A8D9FRW5_9VIRU|nr:MAG: putative DNA polymerase [uncultured marine phage]
MSYHKKETFGDMDVLLYDRGFKSEEIKELIEKLNPGEINRTPNSNVYSFDYKNLQIDLIFVKPENWDASKIFFQWGDLGNLMGKIFNSYGGKIENYIFKYGYDGIKVKLLYETNKKVVYLSKDNSIMFDLLGLDFERFKKGFNDQYEMFDYVMESKFFSYDVFQWENLSSINKQRNKKRPGFHEFLEYIESEKHRVIEWIQSEDYFIDKLNDLFEVNLQEEMKELKDRIDRRKALRSKFSGKTIMEEFNISGKELGSKMEFFRKYIEECYPYGSYEEYIEKCDVNVILWHFKEINKL